MSREEALAFAQKELQAAYERANKIGINGKTRYIEVLEIAIQAMLENEELSKDLDEALKEIDGYERGLSQEPCDRKKNHEEKPHSLLDAYFQMRKESE